MEQDIGLRRLPIALLPIGTLGLIAPLRNFTALMGDNASSLSHHRALTEA